jgi:hypothetical protein
MKIYITNSYTHNSAIYKHLIFLVKLNIGVTNISLTSFSQVSVMNITGNFSKTDYHFFYDFLLVMTEEQIQKLRRIILGYEKISSFTDVEIEELEIKAGKKSVTAPAL